MYLIVMGWLYVTLLMALAEAMSTQGTVLGAIITFLLYGLLPISLVIYLFGTPLRYKARQKSQEDAQAANPAEPSTTQPDAGSHPPALTDSAAVAPVGKVDGRL